MLPQKKIIQWALTTRMGGNCSLGADIAELHRCFFLSKSRYSGCCFLQNVQSSQRRVVLRGSSLLHESSPSPNRLSHGRTSRYPRKINAEIGENAKHVGNLLRTFRTTRRGRRQLRNSRGKDKALHNRSLAALASKTANRATREA